MPETAMPKITDAEQKQYNDSVSALDSYPGGKLSTTEFSNLFGPIAREENRKSRIPASVTIAQAALETGWGQSTIGSAKNLFGIKGTGPAGTTVVATQECSNGTYYTINAGFKKYNTWMESIEDHTQVLKLSYYKNAFNYCNDPDQFAREVHKGGYATAHNYSDQLISIMKSNNLYQWNVYGSTSGESSTDNQTSGATSTDTGTASSGSSGSIGIGTKVKVTGSHYATGQTIPNWVKQNTYTVTQVSGQRALLSDIISWVNMNDLQVIGGNSDSSTSTPKPQTTETATPSTTSDGAASSTSTESMTALQKLLAANPNVKTNQQLINLFYSMGGNTFNGAAAVATQYGVNINVLCQNRSGAIEGATASSSTGSSGSSSSSGGSSSSTTTENKTVYVTCDGLRVRTGGSTDYAIIGSVSTGQALTVIGSANGWYKIKYGADTGWVCASYTSETKPGGSTVVYSGSVKGDPDLATASKNVAAELGTTGWCAKGVHMAIQRRYGITIWGNGNQTDDSLIANGHFTQLDYSLNDALAIPGVIMTWEKTSTTAGQKYGHTAITMGNGTDSACDYYEYNTNTKSSGRSGFKCFIHNDYA